MQSIVHIRAEIKQLCVNYAYLTQPKLNQTKIVLLAALETMRAQVIQMNTQTSDVIQIEVAALSIVG